MRHRRTTVLVLFFLASALVASGQTPIPAGGQAARPGTPSPGAQVPGMPPRDNNRAATPAGTARIRGRVVASDTGAALRRAQVSLTGEYQQQLRQASGAREFSLGEGQSVSVDLRLTPDL